MATERIELTTPAAMQELSAILREGSAASIQTVPPSPFPAENEYLNSYEKITKVITPKSYEAKEMAFVMVCAGIAAVASYYNYAFGREYMRDVAARWGFNSDGQAVFSTFCGLTGLVINMAINGRSLHQAWYLIKDEIIANNVGGRTHMPDDDKNWRTIIAMAVFSIIGAAPNFKFVYDTSKDGNMAYLVIMEFIQFITQSALNLRGLYMTFKLSSEKKMIAERFKLEMLQAANTCLSADNRLTEDDLIALSKGELVKQNLPQIRNVVKLIMKTYVIPYSSAFYFAVQYSFATTISTETGIPTPTSTYHPTLVGNLASDIGGFLVTGTGILSAALKWFFLANAYAGLIDRIFNLFQAPILRVNENEVRSQFISRRTDRILALLGLAVAVFSLGSSSKVVEKYLFDVKTSQTFWYSLLIGGGAALGINAMDLSTIVERLMDFIGYLYKKVNPGNRMDYLGSTHDEMIMRAMLEIATKPPASFLQAYTREIESHDVDIEAINPNVLHPVSSMVNLQARPSTPNFSRSFNSPSEQPPESSHYVHGFVTNSTYNFFRQACSQIRTNMTDIAFNAYKQLKGQREESHERIRELSNQGEVEPLVNSRMNGRASINH